MSAGYFLTSNTPPAQPTFKTPNLGSNGYFSVSVGISNVTGDGTVYSINYDTTRFHNGTDITFSSGTFTVNATAFYHFDWQLGVNLLTSGANQLIGNFNYSGAGPVIEYNPLTIGYVASGVVKSVSSAAWCLYLTATTTFKMNVKVSGGTKGVRIIGNNSGSPDQADANYLSYYRIR